MKWYLKVLRQYAVFRGRARRKEYWFFMLVQVLALLLISWIERILAIANPEILFGWYTTLYLLITLLPALAVTSRRLHDGNCSAWWLLLYLLPPVGVLFLNLAALRRGTSGDNRFGPDPRAIAGTSGGAA
ncbi:MAG: DUF805 domain-containing protein [Enterobacteriaceae bacterium]